MNRHALTVAALFAAVPTLIAQDDKKKAPGDQPSKQDSIQQGAAPNPKTKEHDALKAFAGNWEITHKMTPPGGQAIESKGTQRCELICNGLWLKCAINGQHEGKPYQGLWLLGYDPTKKSYRGIWVDNNEATVSNSEGRYDEKAKTWQFTGSMPTGDFKTTVVLKDADNYVETGTCTQDGKETKMEITAKRAKGALTAEAAATTPPKPPTKEHEELLKTVGDWDATMKVSPAPGAAPVEMPGSEKVIPICDGRYVWTDFRMQWEGQPFEGHALMGYDPTQKKYVSYWFDSMNPVVSESAGTFDPSKKAVTLNGTSRDKNGKPTTTKEVCAWKDDNTRHMTMECKGEQNESFELTLKRKK
jgi:hypothetical protein